LTHYCYDGAMKRVFKKKKASGNYAFIDSQNLNLGIQRAGWKMDWKKFRAYLKEHYDVERAYMFIGYLPENEDLYTQMHEAGYLVALKPTLEMFSSPEDDKKDDKEKIPTKGNVDAELVMYAMKELPNYKKAIIVSGDGDFYSLIEYLGDRQKLLCVMTPNWRYSTLLKPFERYIVRLDTLKSQLAYRNFHSKNKRDKTHIDGQKQKAHNPTNQ
jgi:uncharacterized LabA/DUF88 family protein